MRLIIEASEGSRSKFDAMRQSGAARLVAAIPRIAMLLQNRERRSRMRGARGFPTPLAQRLQCSNSSARRERGPTNEARRSTPTKETECRIGQRSLVLAAGAADETCCART
jgi:hypothetical protein